MKHRTPDVYTVLIARSGKEPTVFLVQPIALWMALGALVTLVLVSFLLGWSQGQSSTKRTASSQVLWVPPTEFT